MRLMKIWYHCLLLVLYPEVRDQNQANCSSLMFSNMFYFHLSFGKDCKLPPLLTHEALLYLSPGFCISLLQVLYNELLSDKRPGVCGVGKNHETFSQRDHVMSWFVSMSRMWLANVVRVKDFSSCLYILIWRITWRSKMVHVLFKWEFLRDICNLIWFSGTFRSINRQSRNWLPLSGKNKGHMMIEDWEIRASQKMQLSSETEVEIRWLISCDFVSAFFRMM